MNTVNNNTEKVTNILTQEVMDNVVMLVPDLNADRKVAVVSLDVLEYLTGLLPKAPFYKILNTFINKVKTTETMEDFVLCLQKEVDFQTSVNMINEYFLPKEEEITGPVDFAPTLEPVVVSH